MILELITPPAAEPFTLTDLKLAFRVDHTAEDDLVMELGQTARRFIERRLSTAMVNQTWQLLVQGVPETPIPLRPGTVTSVTSVEVAYGDHDFAPTTDWRFIRSVPQTVEVTAPCQEGGEEIRELRITFAAGASDPALVPDDLVRATILLAAHYYENREAVAEGRYVAMPMSVEALLQGFREARL
ncbi:MAG: head-tail connector protein [Pseudomonadota bacterium]